MSGMVMFSIVGMRDAQAATGQDKQWPPSSSPVGGEGISLWGSLIQVIIVLIVIIGMILLLVKFLSQKNKIWPGNRAIRLLGGIQLGQNRSLHMVEVGNCLYIVGVGENVHLLDKIEDREEILRIMEQLEQNPGASSVLNWSWMTAWRKERGGRDTEEERETSSSFEEIFHSKMKGVAEDRRKIGQMLSDRDKEGPSS